MDHWVVYAYLAMLFAGFTSVVAKLGLEGISGELGLTVRTLFVTAFVLGFAALAVSRDEFQNLTWQNWVWLAVSGLTTAVSWVFYYKAIAADNAEVVSTVNLIDRGSIVVVVLLAWLLLGEQITWRIALGTGLILAGLLVVSRK